MDRLFQTNGILIKKARKKLFNLDVLLSIAFLIICIIMIIFIVKIIRKCIKWVRNIDVKRICREIYIVKTRNILIVSFLCIILFFITVFLVPLFANLFNIHLSLKLDVNYLLTGYCGFISIIMPVAILIAEKLRDKNSKLLSDAYMKNTCMFPIITYFVDNLLLFSLPFNNQYFFIITFFISAVLIVFMYYRSFKMFTNRIHEQSIINDVRIEITEKDMIEQLSPYDSENLISSYQKYGIVVKPQFFLSTSGYEKLLLYPNSDYLIIENYNYRIVNKLASILKEINKDYISSFVSSSKQNMINIEIEPNVIIVLEPLGSTISRYECWISIYYQNKYKDDVDRIKKIIIDDLYKKSDKNYHLYFKEMASGISLKCVNSINVGSSSMLSESLDEYLDIYKMYINELIEKVGTYSYDVSYNHVHSLSRIKVYECLKNIQKNIFDYSKMIVEKQNDMLMNTLIEFVQKMMLHSAKKNELLSIQYLYNSYEYLNNYSQQLKSDSSIKNIKIQIFEFISLLKYEHKTDKSTFSHDALLVCNKTIGNIIFDLRDNDELLLSYYKDLLEKIMSIKKEFDSILVDGSNEETQCYYKNTRDIYQNYICNLFAISAYLLNYYEKNKKQEKFDRILKLLDEKIHYDVTEILLSTMDMSYNNSFYSWDTMEIKNSYDNCVVYSINTLYYLIRLYCKIVTKDNRELKVESTYQLSNIADSISSELKNINKEEYIKVFDKVKKDVEEEEKQLLRTTTISQEKIGLFKNKFKDEYNKNNHLINLFITTKNYKIVDKKKRGENYLGIRNIVDKTYFLDKVPNNRCIIWTGFEDNFSYSFIEAEEKKFSSSLHKKSKFINNSIIEPLRKLSLSKLKKSIIFSSYDAIYHMFDNDMLDHYVKENDYANMYVKIKKVKIPICIIDGIEDGYAYHTYTNRIGYFEKSKKDFEINIRDFSNNKKLLDEYMKKSIKGLTLEGDEKRDHLLESVDILIKEYVIYNDNKLEASKFDH